MRGNCLKSKLDYDSWYAIKLVNLIPFFSFLNYPTLPSFSAHCTMNFNVSINAINVYTEAQSNPVTVGGGVENVVDRFIQHPGFSRQSFDNDITLLHLSQPLVYSAKVTLLF